jgi:hypothetical protein
MSRPNVRSAVRVLMGADRDKVNEAPVEAIAGPRAAEVPVASVGNEDPVDPADPADRRET